MTQCVATPTRFSEDMTSFSTLDLLATNRPDIVENVVVSDPISDHCCVIADLRLATPNSKRAIFYRPDYERTDWPTLCSRLNSLPLLESIQGTQNIEAAWQVWHNLVWTCVANNVPFRTCNYHSWAQKKMGDAFLAQALPQKTTPLPRSPPIDNLQNYCLGSSRGKSRLLRWLSRWLHSHLHRENDWRLHSSSVFPSEVVAVCTRLVVVFVSLFSSLL